MEKIENQKHTKETFYFAMARMLERASFYGFRSLVVLYMIGETLKIKDSEALSVYGLFMGSFVFSQIIGALFGDLLVGNKKALLIGGIIQAIGTFILCIPSTTGLYLGLFLVVLGNGFFTPNIISNFAKLYLNKTELLDSGFSILYLAINLGSFLGVLIMGYVATTFGYNIGFVISGILMLASIVPVFSIKEKAQNTFDKNEVSINKRILNSAIALVVVGLFWGVYEITNIHNYNLQLHFSQIEALSISKVMWQSMDSILMLPIGLFAIILWSYFYSNSFFKLMLGFIFGIVSLVLLFLIPEIPTEQHTLIYIVSLVFLAISEIYIAPIIYSILTKYGNRKYLAILISLSFIPTRLISLIIVLYNDSIYDNPILGLKIGIIILIIVAIGVFGYLMWDKKLVSKQKV